MSSRYALAFDLGTSSIKAALVDINGNIIASDKLPLTPVYPRPGWAESDPLAWWRSGCEISKKIIRESGIDPSDICGVSFDAPSAGVTPVSRKDGVLYPCMIWLDFRAEELVDELNDIMAEASGDPDLRPWTGKDEIPKLCWTKRNMPDIWNSMDCFLADTGVMVYMATGEISMSKQDAFTYGYDWKAEKWDRDLLDLYDLEERIFPDRILNATEIAGYITREAAADMGVPAGIPVTAGYSDCSGAEFGSGCVYPGDSALYVGTSMLFTYITDENPGHSSACYTFPGVNPAHQMLLATNDMSGGCIDWIVDRLFEPEEKMMSMEACYDLVDKMLEATPPGADGLFFTTSFQGERQPIMDNNVRAGFWNLTTNHGRSHMVRAVYEGIAYQIKWTLDTFCEANGARLDRLLMTGGGARSAHLTQIIADVTGLPLYIAADPGFAVSKGTAFLSFIAAGEMTFDEAREKLRRSTHTVFPNPENREVYNRGSYYYRRYYDVTRGFFAELNKQK